MSQFKASGSSAFDRAVRRPARPTPRPAPISDPSICLDEDEDDELTRAAAPAANSTPTLPRPGWVRASHFAELFSADAHFDDDEDAAAAGIDDDNDPTYDHEPCGRCANQDPPVWIFPWLVRCFIDPRSGAIIEKLAAPTPYARADEILAQERHFKLHPEEHRRIAIPTPQDED